MKIKTGNVEITLPFTDAGKSCSSHRFLTSLTCVNIIHESKILRRVRSAVAPMCRISQGDGLTRVKMFRLNHCLLQHKEVRALRGYFCPL